MQVDSESAEAPFFQYTDSFVVAGPRKKRKHKEPQEPPSPRVLLDRVTDELISGSWFAHCQQLLRDSLNHVTFTTSSVLCLGLGSPTKSRDARAQLAFLVQLCDVLDMNRQDIFIYDPVFTDDDVMLLNELHLQTLTENKNAAYSITSSTLIFMPHCDINMYESMLRQNWTIENLRNMFFIANDFQEYIDSIPKRKLAADYPCLLRFAPIANCRALPASVGFDTAFNNTSCQFVQASALPSVEDGLFWTFPPSSADAHGPCSVENPSEVGQSAENEIASQAGFM